MAHFYRDQIVKDLTLDEDNLRQIYAIFESRTKSNNASLAQDDKTDKRLLFYCIIRFDNKGYRVFSLAELLKYFLQANAVERVVFTVESIESIRTARATGTYMDLRLDEKDSNNCYLGVTSDDSDWVDASFSAVREVLNKCTNKNSWARSTWTHLAVQIIGVILGFVLSMWAAVKIAPQLAIENSFIMSFLFALLIFSNMWTFLNQRILSGINSVFPNLKFYRPGKDRMHWLMQAVIGGIVVAVTLYVLGIILSYAGEVLGSLVRKSA